MASFWCSDFWFSSIFLTKVTSFNFKINSSNKEDAETVWNEKTTGSMGQKWNKTNKQNKFGSIAFGDSTKELIKITTDATARFHLTDLKTVSIGLVQSPEWLHSLTYTVAYSRKPVKVLENFLSLQMIHPSGRMTSTRSSAFSLMAITTLSLSTLSWPSCP